MADQKIEKALLRSMLGKSGPLYVPEEMKRKGFGYIWCGISKDDQFSFHTRKQLGYVPVPAEDMPALVNVFLEGSDAEKMGVGGYITKQSGDMTLILMLAPQDICDQIRAFEDEEAESQLDSIKAEAEAGGGYFNRGASVKKTFGG